MKATLHYFLDNIRVSVIACGKMHREMDREQTRPIPNGEITKRCDVAVSSRYIRFSAVAEGLKALNDSRCIRCINMARPSQCNVLSAADKLLLTEFVVNSTTAESRIRNSLLPLRIWSGATNECGCLHAILVRVSYRVK